jgi:outer membrane receptor protein involved in Fe transport
VYRENTQTLGVFQDDGSPAIDPATQLHSTEKVSYQISPSNKLIGFSQAFHRHSESGDSLLAPYDSRQTQIYSQQTSKLEWQVARGNKFVSIQAGEWAFKLDRTGFDPTHIATFDQVTQRVTGQNIDASTTTFENRKAVTGTVSWYKPDWFFGNHAFKAGFAYWDSHADRRSQDRGAATNMQLVYRTGVPFEVAGYNYPVYPYSHVRNDPLYIQDSWTLARRLTLNLGIRYDHDWAYLPQQCRTTAAAPLDTLFAAQCSRPSIR